MNYPEVKVTVKIDCPNQLSQIQEADVLVIAGTFDRGSVISTVRNNHPGCEVSIVDVYWVVKS